MTAPTVYLAHVPGAQGDNSLVGRNGVKPVPKESRPALLISFVFLAAFLEQRRRYRIRSWVLDSGAFSARSRGISIDLRAYIAACKALAKDETLDEVYALDVIGDWRATIKNTKAMWRAGVKAIPTYHYADRDWNIFNDLCAEYPKVAVGGMADLRGSRKAWFVEQCFARAWPKQLHGFGCHTEKLLMRFPFHSVDATNWELGPCKFGQWRAYGRTTLSWRGSAQDLRAEIEWYLALERKLRKRWQSEMQLIEGGAA